jgi:hypothetical protein
MAVSGTEITVMGVRTRQQEPAVNTTFLITDSHFELASTNEVPIVRVASVVARCDGVVFDVRRVNASLGQIATNPSVPDPPGAKATFATMDEGGTNTSHGSVTFNIEDSVFACGTVKDAVVAAHMGYQTIAAGQMHARNVSVSVSATRGYTSAFSIVHSGAESTIGNSTTYNVTLTDVTTFHYGSDCHIAEFFDCVGCEIILRRVTTTLLGAQTVAFTVLGYSRSSVLRVFDSYANLTSVGAATALATGASASDVELSTHNLTMLVRSSPLAGSQPLAGIVFINGNAVNTLYDLRNSTFKIDAVGAPSSSTFAFASVLEFGQNITFALHGCNVIFSANAALATFMFSLTNVKRLPTNTPSELHVVIDESTVVSRQLLVTVSTVIGTAVPITASTVTVTASNVTCYFDGRTQGAVASMLAPVDGVAFSFSHSTFVLEWATLRGTDISGGFGSFLQSARNIRLNITDTMIRVLRPIFKFHITDHGILYSLADGALATGVFAFQGGSENVTVNIIRSSIDVQSDLAAFVAWIGFFPVNHTHIYLEASNITIDAGAAFTTQAAMHITDFRFRAVDMRLAAVQRVTAFIASLYLSVMTGAEDIEFDVTHSTFILQVLPPEGTDAGGILSISNTALFAVQPYVQVSQADVSAIPVNYTAASRILFGLNTPRSSRPMGTPAISTESREWPRCGRWASLSSIIPRTRRSSYLTARSQPPRSRSTRITCT